MHLLVLDVNSVPFDNEVLECAKHILLDQSQVCSQFFVVDELLNFAVEANSLNKSRFTKFL